MKLERTRRNALRNRLTAATAAAFLTCTGAAAAQAPIVSGYGGAGSVASELGPTGTSAPAAGTSAAPGTDAGGVAGANAGGSSAVPTGDSAVPTGDVATARSAGGEPVPEAAPAASVSLAGNDLPFTGLDIALILVGGLLLVGVGFGARLLSRPRATTQT